MSAWPYVIALALTVKIGLLALLGWCWDRELDAEKRRLIDGSE